MRAPGPGQLLLITDRRLAVHDLAARVAAAIAGGVDGVMLREKDLATDDLVALGAPVRDVCRTGGATFLVNHDIDAALRLGADGVHLGFRSPGVETARAALGPDALVGVSTHDRDELVAAATAGASYVTFGPVFDTPSKEGLLVARGVEGLREAVKWVPGLPVIALGGIGPPEAALLGGTGTAGLAAIRALLAPPDPAAAARALLRAWSGA